MSDRQIIKGKSGIAFYEYTSWCHRYKIVDVNGKIIYKKLKGFKTEEEAVNSYYKLNQEFEEQLRELYARTSKDIMFKDYLIYWFENIYSTRIQTTTKMVGSYIIYNLIIPNIDYDVKINLVTTDYLDKIIESCSKVTESGGYSARTIIIMAMKDAVTSGYINYNPSLKTKIYHRKKAKIRVFSKEQMKRFLNLAKSSNWYFEILIGLFCGLRKGEILALKFEDFDYKNKSISIERQLVIDYQMNSQNFKIENRKLIERDPKTKNSIRTIKVPNIIFEELKKRKEYVENQKAILSDNYIDNNYISCQDNGLPHSLSSLNNCISKLCNKLNLPHITVHGLRHMCATILLEQGVSLAKIAAYLGHNSIHTTFEYYCEVMDEKEKILAFMNEVFSVDDEVEYVD